MPKSSSKISWNTIEKYILALLKYTWNLFQNSWKLPWNKNNKNNNNNNDKTIVMALLFKAENDYLKTLDSPISKYLVKCMGVVVFKITHIIFHNLPQFYTIYPPICN